MRDAFDYRFITVFHHNKWNFIKSLVLICRKNVTKVCLLSKGYERIYWYCEFGCT